jgi:hypothetical protein
MKKIKKWLKNLIQKVLQLSEKLEKSWMNTRKDCYTADPKKDPKLNHAAKQLPLHSVKVGKLERKDDTSNKPPC